MNRDELVETIIREVKRVLDERGIPVGDTRGSTPAQAPAATRKQPQPPSAVTPQPVLPRIDQKVGGSDISGKQVITQKDLEEFRGTSIRVTRRAVITPLAIDYAREKGITITRVDEVASPDGTTAAGPGTAAVALAIARDFPGDKGVITAFLKGKGFEIREFSDREYEEGLKKLAAAVAAGSVNFGVCFDKTGMEGPIFSNRNPGVRAVHCRTTLDARAARVDYGANIIVIDSTSDPNAVISGFCGLI